ncbi:general secretion pathway protein GspK [Acidovorax sp. HMWF029]|uniref:general secretion pathway protein GspK n=1 Tax=unclassified Acidovorax TaxID=2684926 RepID=UPI000D336B83|nr:MULTISPECIES: type II secretion system protein GspK [unclassified Acidovorax]MDH4416560.1 type II secretion system protein GspK [Acidovorax sp.]PTT22149.1 general secretion pathway protein GspK [Acidovorax sp. HMWF029]
MKLLLAPGAGVGVRVTRSRGMALIAVLWVVAALTILVTGFSRVARDEVGIVASARQGVFAQAMGDAAIALALREVSGVAVPISRVQQVEVAYGGVKVPVFIMPLNGLIDLNAAPPGLLVRLYVVAGGLPEGAAEALAQATVEARTRAGPMNQPERFEANEDLLRVPGVDYDLYARLSPLLTVYARAGGGRVNPMAAPLEVLTVLANGNAAIAGRIVRERDQGAQWVDTTSLEASYIGVSPFRRYRVTALVPLADGTRMRVSRTVDLGFSSRDGLPWRTLHAERSFEPVPRTVAN